MTLPKMEPFPLLDTTRHELARRRAVAICKRVAALYGLTLADLRAHTRAGIVTEARQLACYLARRLTGLSYPALGRVLARHHSTVLHACRSISIKLARWPGGTTALAVAQAEEACS